MSAKPLPMLIHSGVTVFLITCWRMFMKDIRRKKRSALLMALLLAASILFGSVRTVQSVQAATNNYYIKINKGTNVVTVYKQDGTPYTAFVCSIGYATPVGTFHTMAKYRWWVLDGPCYGQYCTRITGSILFHSVWYYQQTKNSQSYRQYNKLGTTASHGCCRLTVAASKWIYDNCPTGTKVIIFNGSAKDDPLGKPKAIKVKGYSGWDPTDPDKNNPYKTRSTKPVITVSKKTIVYGSKFGDGNMTCKDSGGFDITDWVKMTGKVNTKKLGNYTVTYSVVDSFGRTATKKVTYKVVDNKAATLSGVKSKVKLACGDTRNMLTGLKAKTAAGTNLTNKIAVYVKAPGSDSYVKCKEKNYTFTTAGIYNVKYVVKNPNNGIKTTKKQKITVIDTGIPTFVCENDWNDIRPDASVRTLYWDILMMDVSALLADGEDISESVKITIEAPDGNTVTIAEGECYTFSQNGTYTLTYQVINPNSGKSAQQKRSLVFAEDAQTEDVSNE